MKSPSLLYHNKAFLLNLSSTLTILLPAYKWSCKQRSGFLIRFFLYRCYYRSRPRRSEEEDDNSPHRREQQQHLEIKAIVWVFLFQISVSFPHFLTSVTSSVTDITSDLESALCLLSREGDQFICGFNSIIPLIKLAESGSECTFWTLADRRRHLTPFHLNTVGVRGKDRSRLRLSLRRTSGIEKEKANAFCLELTWLGCGKVRWMGKKMRRGTGSKNGRVKGE